MASNKTIGTFTKLMQEQNAPLKIVIGGSIASGKSTILKLLEEIFANNAHVLILPEPVADWEKIAERGDVTLKDYYSCHSSSIRTLFQMKVMSTLAEREAYLQSTPHSAVFLERDVNSCQRFITAQHKQHLLDLPDQVQLSRLVRSISSLCSPVSFSFILEVSPIIAFSRTRQRARDGEEGITLKYLQDLETSFPSDTSHYINTDNKTPIQVAETVLQFIITSLQTKKG